MSLVCVTKGRTNGPIDGLTDRVNYIVIVIIIVIQLTPAPTDFKGPTIFICYWRISVIANIENKGKPIKGLKNSFCYRRISVTGGSVIARVNCNAYWIITMIMIKTMIILSLTSRFQCIFRVSAVYPWGWISRFLFSVALSLDGLKVRLSAAQQIVEVYIALSNACGCFKIITFYAGITNWQTNGQTDILT